MLDNSDSGREADEGGKPPSAASHDPGLGSQRLLPGTDYYENYSCVEYSIAFCSSRNRALMVQLYTEFSKVSLVFEFMPFSEQTGLLSCYGDHAHVVYTETLMDVMLDLLGYDLR